MPQTAEATKREATSLVKSENLAKVPGGINASIVYQQPQSKSDGMCAFCWNCEKERFGEFLLLCGSPCGVLVPAASAPRANQLELQIVRFTAALTARSGGSDACCSLRTPAPHQGSEIFFLQRAR